MCAKKRPAQFEPDMQDAVIYARYSSHNQRDCSIEQQVADCEIFARQNNLRVVKVYADRHLSGTNDQRPQFQQMLKDAAHGRWAYVICWKIDRFARNRYDSATHKFRLKKAGVRVLYAKESIPDGPEGILLESVLEGSAEYYSASLAQNIRRGMKYNAEQCKVNSGSIPFGYCKGPDGRFAIHEANAEVVREIFRKAAAGMPFVDIANDLNSRGLKTSRGGRWNKGSFRLLMNESYIGVYHFSDTRIEGGMPALIDQGTFWAANERLKANSSVRGRHQDGGDYLLTGKLKCAHCGSYMIGFSGTGKNGELHYYYGCQKRRRERACKKANVPREWIERVVVKAALDYVLRPDVMEWIADAVMEYQEREAASAQLAALTAELEENQKATDNVMKAIEAGIITSTTKQRLLDLEAKAQDLKRAIELEKLSHVRLERDQVLFWLDRFRGGSLQSQEFRRKVIDAFVSVVYLSDDHLRIAFNYSGGSNAEADFDLVMDAEAAAGELSKKFAQGHVASGIILKKTKIFAGDPAPFVMELPAYHVPAWGNVFRATWERGWSFIKRAGSVILASTVILWFLQGFGFENGVFGMVEDQDNSMLAIIATKIAWIFAPLGFGNWKATVASVTGLIAKENVVGTFGVLYHFGGELSENGDEIWAAVAQDYTALSAYAFMIFNLLCAPCFAAMGAIKREMNNGKWTAIAIGYMCALAYCSALVVYQLGGIISGEVGFNFFTIVAVVILAAFIYLLVRPNKYTGINEVKIDTKKITANK